MRLPLLKAVSATALTILPLLAPAVGGLALTPGLTTAALACPAHSSGDPRLQRGKCNDVLVTPDVKTNPCARRSNTSHADDLAQMGNCNYVRLPIKGRDGGSQRMPSIENAGRVPINRGAL